MHSSSGWGPQARVCNVSEEDRRQRAIRDVQREIDATSANVEIGALSTVVRLHADLWLYGVGFAVLQFLIGNRNVYCSAVY